MTASSLPAALRAGADALHALEAATGLIIAHASWLAREGLRPASSTSAPASPTPAPRWPASSGKPRSTRLAPANSPPGRGERRMLHLAASLARDVPVSLGEAITGIDDHNVGLLVKAVLHASGRRQFPR